MWKPRQQQQHRTTPIVCVNPYKVPPLHVNPRRLLAFQYLQAKQNASTKFAELLFKGSGVRCEHQPTTTLQYNDDDVKTNVSK